MPDDESVETPTVETPAAPAAPDPRDAAIAELRGTVAALNDSVRAALAPARQPVAAGGNVSPDGITPQLRAALRQQGMSDADITHNAPLILPFISVFAPELVGIVEGRVAGVDERLSLKELVDDTDAYPYAKDLKSEISKIRKDHKAEHPGQPMSIETAYHTAVSMNQEKCREIDATRRRDSAGVDASMLSGVGHRTTSNASARSAGRDAGPRTAADLSKMTHEQRLAYYDKIGDLPIQ